GRDVARAATADRQRRGCGGGPARRAGRRVRGGPGRSGGDGARRGDHHAHRAARHLAPRVGPPHAQAGEEALTRTQLLAAAAAALVGVGLFPVAADAVAHNFFVPRQLLLTSGTAALGHSYWESRFETHLGPAYASTAKELILQDHTPSDTHLDTIISPTLFSVGTSRRLFRGMVHLTESESWRWAFQIILENTRWDLPDADVERHMAVAFEYVMEMLGQTDAAARRLDPAGDQALKLAKRMRRQALHEGGREDPERMLETAEDHFGLPTPSLAYWKQSQAQRPWRDRDSG